MLIYSILKETPVWLLFTVLFALTYAAIFVGRHVFEGLTYQVSFAAFIGDFGLLVSVLIAATILQRTSFETPYWLKASHLWFAVAMIILGVLICKTTLSSRDGKVMDIYHDVVIFPIIAYFAFTLLPMIWLYGNTKEQVATFFFIFLWLSCVVFDIMGDRMNQRKLLRRMGLRFSK